jgi:hypothetical protein
MEKGLLGGFTGKIGNVIGFTGNGKYFVKSVPAKHKDNPKAMDLEHRAKFGLMRSFISFMTPVIRITFNQKNLARNRKCFAWNFRNAITGTYPNFNIDYAKVQLARGRLFPADNATVDPMRSCKLKFTWPEEDNRCADGSDTVVLICYCPELAGMDYSFGPARRSEMKAVLHVPAFKGHLVHTWITFISKAGVADSVYCGSVTVLLNKRGTNTTRKNRSHNEVLPERSQI